MDRIARLVDVLRAAESVTVAELAARLGVSGRTVRRDLAHLADRGVEVRVRPGRGGGVSLVRDSSLPTMRFTDDEALALALALGAAAADPRLADAVRGVRTRLARSLTDKYGRGVMALADAAADQRRVLLGGDDVDGAVLLSLCVASARRHRVEMHYRSSDGRRRRRPLDPYAVVPMAGHWYVVGFCGLRREVRTFRVDRVSGVREVDARFEVPPDLEPAEVVAAGIRTSGRAPLLVDLLLDLDEDAARALAPTYRMELERRDDGLHAVVRAEPRHLRELALLVLGIGSDVRVVSPPELRDELLRLSQRAADLAAR